MALIKCPDCGKEVSDIAPSCPNCGRPSDTQHYNQVVSNSSEVYGKKKSGKVWLIIIAIIFFLWLIGRMCSPVSHDPTSDNSSDYSPKLELISSSWHTEYDYAIYEGRVKNISSQSLENVEAVASFFDNQGVFITSSSAIIEYNPILPGQISNFKVMKTLNPEMKKASIEFKSLLGGSIPHK
jgi:hypothetical protein